MYIVAISFRAFYSKTLDHVNPVSTIFIVTIIVVILFHFHIHKKKNGFIICFLLEFGPCQTHSTRKLATTSKKSYRNVVCGFICLSYGYMGDMMMRTWVLSICFHWFLSCIKFWSSAVEPETKSRFDVKFVPFEKFGLTFEKKIKARPRFRRVFYLFIWKICTIFGISSRVLCCWVFYKDLIFWNEIFTPDVGTWKKKRQLN